MRRIALLTAGNLVSDAPNRRADAYLFDAQMRIVGQAFAEQRLELTSVDWTDPALDWPGFAAVLVNCAWDYQDRADEFLARLDSFAATGLPVFNSVATVKWNIRKTYLRDFEAAGVPIIPTLWPEAPDAGDLAQAFEKFGSDEIVLKRQVGGGARSQEKFSRASAPKVGRVLDRPGMIQPLIGAIRTEGEYSFLFVDGAFSHALVKQAKTGDYRIQAAYGGVSTTIDPSPQDKSTARAVLDVCAELPLYARVDMVRGDDGRLLLMELEAIEPFLFPEEGPQIAGMLAAALCRRLG